MTKRSGGDVVAVVGGAMSRVIGAIGKEKIFVCLVRLRKGKKMMTFIRTRGGETSKTAKGLGSTAAGNNHCCRLLLQDPPFNGLTICQNFLFK